MAKTGILPGEPYFGWNRVAYEAEDVPDWGDHAVYEHDLGRRVPQDIVGRQVGKLVHGRRATQSQYGRAIRLIHLKTDTYDNAQIGWCTLWNNVLRTWIECLKDDVVIFVRVWMKFSYLPAKCWNNLTDQRV